MRTRWRSSKREQALTHNAAIDFLAAASENPRAALASAFKRPVPSQRAPRVDHPDLEKHVIRAVSELLAVHPRVLFAVRQNTGGASYEAKSGKYAPIFFYHILTSQPVTITDFWGLLRDGRPFALEAKRPSWREPREEREFKQAAFLMLIRNCGGVAGFVRSAGEAKALLDGG